VRATPAQPRELLVLAVCVAWTALAATAHAVPEQQLGSSDTAATSISVSLASYPSGAPAVVLAETWHDQLCGAALAGAVKGPLLVASRAGLAPSVRAEITRTLASRAFIVGDYSAVAISQVRSALPPGSEITTLSGPTAEKTSEYVAHQVAAERGTPPERVLVAPLSRPDLSLALAAPAYARAWPIVFAGTDAGLPARVATQTAAASALVIDGAGAADGAADRLDVALGPAAVRRVSYKDGYLAAWGIAEWSVANAGLAHSNPVFATRASASNLIAAGTLAARRGSTVVAVPVDSLPPWLADRLYRVRTGLASNAFVGTVPALRKTDTRHAQKAPLFSAVRAKGHVKVLAKMGPRRAGTRAERRGADYIARTLRSYGYSVSVRKVRLPNGRTSRNVVAEKRGSTSDVIVIGAHMDSKSPSPGANDNASGVGVMLELARIMSQATVAPTVRLIAFGAEEIVGSKPTNHHFGSRSYVRSLSSAERARIEGMLSIDMVGYGKTFTVRNLRKAPMTTVRSLRSWGSYTGLGLTYLKDPSRDGWSDHEAFEFKGIPVAWLEWRTDPKYHTRGDRYSHVRTARLRSTGRLVRGWLLEQTPATVEALR